MAAHLGEDPAEGVGQQRQQDHRQAGPQPALGRQATDISPQRPEGEGTNGHRSHAGADHPAEGPVGDRDDRAVVRRLGQRIATEGQLVLGLQVVDALDPAVERAGGQERQQLRNPDRPGLVLTVRRADRDDREGRTLALGRGVVQRLGRRHFHRLHLGHHPALEVTRDRDGDPAQQQDDGAEPGGAAIHAQVALGGLRAPHQPQCNAQHERTTAHPRGRDHVRKRDQLHLVGEDRNKVGELGTAGDRIVGVANRVLHERVGGQDEEGGQDGADVHQPDRPEVNLLVDATPSEDPQAEERAFEEEGQQRLDGERCAEDVADESGVVRPVHAELELLNDAGGQPEDEVDREQLAEELGEAQPLGIAGAHPKGLHQGHDE